MKKLIVLVIFLGLITQIQTTAQQSMSSRLSSSPLALANTLHSLNLTNLSEKADEKPYIGFPYLYEKWSKAFVNFGEEEVLLDNVKIDLLNDYLEVKIEGVEKILDKEHFNNFILTSPRTGETITFVKSENYKLENGKQLKGFMKQRVAGDLEVLTYYAIRIATHIGRSSISEYKSDGKKRIVKKEKIYIAKKGKLYRIKRKKDLYKVFRNKKKVNTLIKKNNLNIKSEQDLVKLATLYQKKRKKK